MEDVPEEAVSRKFARMCEAMPDRYKYSAEVSPLNIRNKLCQQILAKQVVKNVSLL